MKRHWKQHWDPKVDLVARRRLRMGDDPNKPFVMPGEVLSQQLREKLGLNRLRRWFENGTLDIAEFKAPEPQRRLALQARGEAPVAVIEKPPQIVVVNVVNEGGIGHRADDAIINVLKRNKDTVDKLIEPVEDQARLERNAKAREKRAADKKSEVQRVERNRKAREKRAAKHVNSGV